MRTCIAYIIATCYYFLGVVKTNLEVCDLREKHDIVYLITTFVQNTQSIIIIIIIKHVNLSALGRIVMARERNFSNPLEGACIRAYTTAP